MQAIQLLFVLIVAVVAASAQKSYDGFKLYKVVPKTEKQVKILEQIRDAGLGDFWMDYFRVDDNLRVLVSPEMQEVVQGRLMQAGLEVKTIIDDVQQVINQQLNPNQVVSSRSSGFLSYDWDSYHNLTVIEEWLDEVAAAYPSVVSLVTMGYSVENRPIRGIIINYNSNITKPVGIIEGTLHAREWISPATVTWIIKEFLNSTDADVRAMAEDTEWHIFPVVNPDGYEYTFNSNRMWRKNRSTANFTSCNSTGVNDDMSNGVDLNRNFDFYWMSVGASDNPCTNTFAGPSAGSEPETKAISQYVLNLHQGGRNIMYYLSFHSFSQLFILPYSHVTEPAADNHDDLMVIASNSSRKIFERYQTTYRVGIAQEVLYPMSGSSFDWVKLYADASVSYLIELRDLGETGFLLPPEQIIPNNLEMMDGLIEMDKATKRLGYFSGASSVIYSLTLVSLAVVFVNLIN